MIQDFQFAPHFIRPGEERGARSAAVQLFGAFHEAIEPDAKAVDRGHLSLVATGGQPPITARFGIADTHSRG